MVVNDFFKFVEFSVKYSFLEYFNIILRVLYMILFEFKRDYNKLVYYILWGFINIIILIVTVFNKARVNITRSDAKSNLICVVVYEL